MKKYIYCNVEVIILPDKTSTSGNLVAIQTIKGNMKFWTTMGKLAPVEPETPTRASLSSIEPKANSLCHTQ